MNRFVELCSTTPAKMFGLFPRKGTIAVGSDADIVIFDPNRKATLGVKTLHMKVDYNPYEGRTVQGSPSLVISNGEVIIDGDSFVGKKGRGASSAAGRARRRPGCKPRSGWPVEPGTAASPPQVQPALHHLDFRPLHVADRLREGDDLVVA
jgi:hypothetical protein